MQDRTYYYYYYYYYYYLFICWQIKKISCQTYKNGKPKMGIKNYKDMSGKTLSSTLDELERNSKNISQKGLEQIAKMQNLSQNEL